MATITMKELLEAGVHFGHQTKRWNPKMKEYIFGERNGIYIIDLQKTLKLFKDASKFVTELCASGKTILVDVRHPRAVGLFGHGILRLALGADKQNRLAARAQFGNELRRVLEKLERLLQVDNVDPVALAKDVFLHLGIPALGLMPEVNTRFEQLLHCDRGQWASFVDCIRVVDASARIEPAYAGDW